MADSYNVESVSRPCGKEDMIIDVGLPTVFCYLLDDFSRFRLDSELANNQFLVIDVPQNMSVLSRVPVAAFICENMLYLRVCELGTFMTFRVKLGCSDPVAMKQLLNLSSTHGTVALAIISSERSHGANQNLEAEHQALAKQVEFNRIYQVTKLLSNTSALRHVSRYDDELL